MAEEISVRQADEQEAFSAYLISLFKPKDAKQFDETIAKLTPKEINDLYKQFKTMEGITFAGMGAKLDYLQRLNGKCPEGYEIEKYMAGGCVKCRKKLLKNTPLMDKCGGKVKKRISKKEVGGRVKQHIKKGLNGVNLKATGFSTDPNYNTRLLSVDKCGGKMKKRVKKAENGSFINTPTGLAAAMNRTAKQNYSTLKNNNQIQFGKCGMKKRISKKEEGSAFKPIEGGPGMTESTKGAKLNPKQSQAAKGKKRI